MSDKEIALELLKALIESKGFVYGENNAVNAEGISDMYEIVYNKVHSLKDDISNT